MTPGGTSGSIRNATGLTQLDRSGAESGHGNVMGKSWNITNWQKSCNFVISHGILPILPRT